MPRIAKFTTDYIAPPGTPALAADQVWPTLLNGGFPVPHDWNWSAKMNEFWCELCYLARGPGRTLKIGVSRKPRDRLRVFSYPSNQAGLIQRLGASGHHRLLLVISGGDVHNERALGRLVADECVSGEWFRGPKSELLVALLCSAAVPFSQARKAA